MKEIFHYCLYSSCVPAEPFGGLPDVHSGGGMYEVAEVKDYLAEKGIIVRKG